jgi:hypothetical protein
LQLSEGLAVVAGKLEPVEAARLLTQALAQEKNVFARWPLTKGLAAVAGRLEPAEAARICIEVARSEIHGLDRGIDEATQPEDVERVSILLQPLDSEAASHAAGVFARCIVSQSDLYYRENGMGLEHAIRAEELLERFLTHSPRSQVRQRAIALAVAIGTTQSDPLASLASLQAAAEPLPCRFTTQELVELLKMPTCVGEVRRVILYQLGNRYGRRFDTHWDFVRFAQEKGLNLDFTTPPKRPDRKLPLLFQE